MNFNEFKEKAELEIKKYIKCEDAFECNKVSEIEESFGYTAIYVVKSIVTGNIFIVRFIFEDDVNEFNENYVVFTSSESQKIIEILGQ